MNVYKHTGQPHEKQATTESSVNLYQIALQPIPMTLDCVV